MNLLAADVVWSYFQDKFSTTHYVGIVGGNGSGKTTIGDTFAAVGYRAVTMTDPTAANIFRVLGKIEYGQCTIVMDEAEKIDKSPDIMSVLKSGYQFNAKVAKINMNNETQQWFYPYCLKFIIAERSPNQSDAKGVLDRTLSYTAYKGNPQYDVKEILNPAGNEQRQKLLDELVDFRKLMLVYRLIHFKGPIPDIDVGLDGRDKGLCKPLLQLFDNAESYEEIRSTLQTFLNAKNQKKSNLIEAALLPIIANLLSAANGNGNHKELRARVIWERIIGGSLEGHWDEKKPNEFQSADYGIIYRNTITNIICDKFGAEKRHDRGGSVLKFDVEKLVKIAKTYATDTNIQTKISSSAGKDGEGDGSDGSEGSMEDAGYSKEGCDRKNVGNGPNYDDKSQNFSISCENITTDKDNEQTTPSQEPSQLSQPSPPPTIGQSRSIYRIGHSDRWACKNCNLRDDKWFMQQHLCRGG